jgi:hypothetical protein
MSCMHRNVLHQNEIEKERERDRERETKRVKEEERERKREWREWRVGSFAFGISYSVAVTKLGINHKKRCCKKRSKTVWLDNQANLDIALYSIYIIYILHSFQKSKSAFYTFGGQLCSRPKAKTENRSEENKAVKNQVTFYCDFWPS